LLQHKRNLEIRPLTRKFARYCSHSERLGDIDGFMNGYARGETTVFISGDEVTRGWQTVRDRYLNKYGDRGKMGTLTFSDLEIEQLAGDCAIALGRWQLKRATDNPRGRFTLIFRRTPDGWRIVHDHTSAAAP
jgi:ketosteroid isomerase-like protein